MLSVHNSLICLYSYVSVIPNISTLMKCTYFLLVCFINEADLTPYRIAAHNSNALNVSRLVHFTLFGILKKNNIIYIHIHVVIDAFDFISFL